jgi:histone H3/H4
MTEGRDIDKMKGIDEEMKRLDEEMKRLDEETKGDSKKGTIRKSLSKNIRNPSLKRLSFRAGCKRLESETYDELRTTMYDHLRQVIHHSLLTMQHSGRNTLTLDDVLFVLRNHNHSSVYM